MRSGVFLCLAVYSPAAFESCQSSLHGDKRLKRRLVRIAVRELQPSAQQQDTSPDISLYQRAGIPAVFTSFVVDQLEGHLAEIWLRAFRLCHRFSMRCARIHGTEVVHTVKARTILIRSLPL